MIKSHIEEGTSRIPQKFCNNVSLKNVMHGRKKKTFVKRLQKTKRICCNSNVKRKLQENHTNSRIRNQSAQVKIVNKKNKVGMPNLDNAKEPLENYQKMADI